MCIKNSLLCDKTSNCTELLQKGNAVTVHQRNLEVLATVGNIATFIISIL